MTEWQDCTRSKFGAFSYPNPAAMQNCQNLDTVRNGYVEYQIAPIGAGHWVEAQPSEPFVAGLPLSSNMGMLRQSLKGFLGDFEESLRRGILS